MIADFLVIGAGIAGAQEAAEGAARFDEVYRIAGGEADCACQTVAAKRSCEPSRIRGVWMRCRSSSLSIFSCLRVDPRGSPSRCATRINPCSLNVKIFYGIANTIVLSLAFLIVAGGNEKGKAEPNDGSEYFQI